MASKDTKARRNDINICFKELFETKMLSDVQIIVGDEQIKAHRLILTAFSPYFKSMFDTKSQYEESITGKIIITDFDYDVVMQMLEFIYTGKASKLCEMTMPLMRIADKYEIKALLSKCCRTLIPKICVENALQMLILSDDTNSEILNDAALTFIKKNYEDVRNRDEWTAFRREHGPLLEKITDYSNNYKSPKKKKLKI